MAEPKILTTHPTLSYALLDSGDGEKLERYGAIVVARPDPQALWKKLRAPAQWAAADAIFTRDDEDAGWKIGKQVPERWNIELAGIKLWVRPTSFKHMGVFPEQVPNWTWISDLILRAARPITVLNLFGYTGGASLAAAAAGAEVCHVDGSRVAINWARDNAKLAGLENKPVRWILDDVRGFLKRELKRGRRYDGIIMDPPAFGHGADKEVWKIEDDFLPLLDLCREILSDKPLFFLINGYASGYSSIAYENNLTGLVAGLGGAIEIGELTIAEELAGRLLPSGIFARWNAIV